MSSDFDDGIITLGDGNVSVNGIKVRGSRQWVRDPRLHDPTPAMIEAQFRRALANCVIVAGEAGTRWCYKCGYTKLLDEFAVDGRYEGGHEWRCKACEAKRKQLRRAAGR